VNGATRALVWVYYASDAVTDVRSCQDITGDGVRDVVSCRGDDAIPEQVTALNGATGAHIWSRQIGNALWNLTFITDITGDGIREVVPSTWAGSLNCINGATGATVWTVATGGQQRVVTLDDVNGDGVEDIAVGYNTTSAVRCFSGLNGALLWTRAFTDWTWAIDRLADVTGDGINDVCVGDFDGKATVLSGVDGSVFWSWLNPTGDKIMTIRGVPDLNGNGAPDVVAGTQMLTNGTGGDVYALEGNVAPTGVPWGPGLAGLHLSEAAPNPSRGRAVWSLLADRPGIARLQLFAADGRRVRELGGAEFAAGTLRPLVWDGRDDSGLEVPGGVYHARLLYNGVIAADRRVVVLR
jgi:outer membrane protein assembly factor BamB